MSDTMGILRTDEKDVFTVWSDLDRAIQGLITDASGEKGIIYACESGHFSIPKCYIPHMAERTLHVTFTYQGERRLMRVYMDQDGHYQESAPGKKIVLGMGNWGRSAEIMTGILSRLDLYGEVLIDIDDTDDKGFTKL